MPQIAEAAFQNFLATYEKKAAPRHQTSLARHIAIVSLLQIVESGWAVDHWLEETVERFKSASDMGYFTFAKSASAARAIVHCGAVDGMPVLSLVSRLSRTDQNLHEAVAELVGKVSVHDALKRRTWRKGLNLQDVETLHVLSQVEELLIRAEQSDGKAAGELTAIAQLIERWSRR